MKLRAMLALTAVFALGAIAAGCGSSDDDSSSTSNITKAEFIAKADAICKTGDQVTEQKAKQQFGNQKPTAAEVQQFVTETALPDTKKEIEQIRALGVPSGDEDQVNKILDTVDADIEQAQASGTVSEHTFDDANALAKQYGLKVCGQS